MSAHSLVMAAAGAGSGAPAVDMTNVGVTWTYTDGLAKSNTFLGNNPLYAACAVGTKFITSPYGVRTASSTDGGVNWSYVAGASGGSFTAYTLRTFAVSGTTCVGVGDYGTCIVSTNSGGTWSEPASYSGAMSYVSGVCAYGSAKFVAVGLGGYSATSTDGVTWTSRTGLQTVWGTTTGARSIAWSGSKFLVVGVNGAAATSPDGITWTNQAGLANSDTAGWPGSQECLTAWNGTRFVALGNWGVAGYSSDGVTWTKLTALGPYGSPQALAWCGTKFYAAYGGYLLTSTDGITWSAGTLPAEWTTSGGGNVGGIAWNGSRVLLVGYYGNAVSSADGVTWTIANGLQVPDTYYGPRNINAACWGLSKFVVCGAYTASGGASIAYSADGSSWTKSVSGAPTYVEFSAAAASPSLIVLGGSSGSIVTSTDGATWTSRPSLAATTWSWFPVYALAWNGSVFLAVGYSGACATSPDGITWTYQAGLSATAWGTKSARGCVWSGSKFVVVGDSCGVATSPDGVTWTYQAGLSAVWPAGYQALGVAWSGTKFVAVGMYATVATSTDGVTWTSQAGLAAAWGSNHAMAVGWDGTKFIAVGGGFLAATSSDGATWVNRGALAGAGPNPGTALSLAISPTLGKAVVAGQNGIAAFSP